MSKQFLYIVIFIIFFVFNINVFSQNRDVLITNCYLELFVKLSKNQKKVKKVLVINDSYFDIQPNGVFGFVLNPDSLIFSNVRRKCLNDSIKNKFPNDSLIFRILPNYFYIKNDFNLFFSGQYKTERLVYYYVNTPINDMEFYNLLFENCTKFSLTIPVQCFISDGFNYESKLKVYNISTNKRNKIIVKLMRTSCLYSTKK